VDGGIALRVQSGALARRRRAFSLIWLNMKTAPTIVRLWDYGWLSQDWVELPAAPSDAALIQEYVASPAFHTSFLPSDKDETGIHGPFRADRIAAVDFLSLEEPGLEPYLQSVELSETPGEDEIERAKVLPYLRSSFGGGSQCYVLKADEKSKDLFHDWGSVLWVFREFLFIGSGRDRLHRFIIGYD